jgi:ABC-type oligopeptide transport system substrate-binding subunit
MRLTKWLFFVYLAGLGLLAALLGTSLALVPPRDPQTLYTAYGSNVRTLDPAEISDTTSSAIAGNIFECLYNYDYYARPYRLFAELAADLPQISADTLTYTIRLRRGIHFHDPDRVVFPKGRGPELRAQDVIYSLKRIANFHLASPNAAFIAGKIKGIDDWTKYTQQTSPPRSTGTGRSRALPRRMITRCRSRWPSPIRSLFMCWPICPPPRSRGQRSNTTATASASIPSAPAPIRCDIAITRSSSASC